MTTDHADAVAAYGFTRRQATFLTTVMLHSGVCLPRQYTRFAGIVFGHTTREFFARLTAKKFATAYECWRRGGTYYHVHHKGLYAAIGEPDNRNRRRPTVPRTAERLMLLDVVLSEPQMHWLATEREKQAFFVTERKLGHEKLPALVFEQGGIQTVRYFPDKLPIAVGPLGEPTFVYLVTDADQVGVQRFIVKHLDLLRSLHRCAVRLVFPAFLVAGQTRQTKAVESFFAPPLRPVIFEEFRWFCGARRAIEQPSAAALAVDRQRYSRARRAFSSPWFYFAYRSWLRQGDSALDRLRSPSLNDAWRSGAIRLETQVLSHQYLHLASSVETA